MLINDTVNTGRKNEGSDWGYKRKVKTVFNRWTEVICRHLVTVGYPSMKLRKEVRTGIFINHMHEGGNSGIVHRMKRSVGQQHPQEVKVDRVRGKKQ